MRDLFEVITFCFFSWLWLGVVILGIEFLWGEEVGGLGRLGWSGRRKVS